MAGSGLTRSVCSVTQSLGGPGNQTTVTDDQVAESQLSSARRRLALITAAIVVVGAIGGDLRVRRTNCAYHVDNSH
jgi:hypothetical protein